MNPIGRNQNVSGDSLERLTDTPLKEMRRYLIARLVKSRELMIRDDPLIPEAGSCRLLKIICSAPRAIENCGQLYPACSP